MTITSAATWIRPAMTKSATVCRCPYYRTAEHQLYGTLTITGINKGDSTGYADTYWDSLPTTTLTNAQCGIDLPNFPNKYKSSFMADPNNPTCGEYLQFTSQYPGYGPCYPVLVETVDHLNRFCLSPPTHCSSCCKDAHCWRCAIMYMGQLAWWFHCSLLF